MLEQNSTVSPSKLSFPVSPMFTLMPAISLDISEDCQ